MKFIIDPQPLEINALSSVLSGEAQLILSENAQAKIEASHRYLQTKIAQGEESFYGINTGFGSLCNVAIPEDQLEILQERLILSHACGMGDLVSIELSRLILFLKIKNLSLGYSGVRLKLIDRMIELFNHDVIPVIYELGSLGASGDLSPLAHMSLPLIGAGEVWVRGKKMTSTDALSDLQLSPIKLGPKEGIALLNGTQFSTAYSIYAIIEGRRLGKLANFIAAASIEAFQCKTSPFDVRLHEIRPHKGQVHVAKTINNFLAGSEIIAAGGKAVQDPYSFRCVPQVHGASFDTLAFVENTLTIELNSATDNPNLFPESDGILSGGNFHAQPIALAADFLAIALAEFANISERRTFQLISGNRELPAFLTSDAGLNSGLMIPQYTAASIVSQNKQLCTPASVDSIVSSNGQEDHVSMAANASTKLYRVVKNVERVLAIEWMTATQALTFRKPLQSAVKIQKAFDLYREEVPALGTDRYLSPDMIQTINFLKNIDVLIKS